ncbi:adenylosuccinate lyase family protein [Nonomuraea africana]|uniref:3-carboxy-cis,cis-muconate cycloisomerase n=1 Tax=Nonomuraea africana TaxID=46171 RepID=A0ABR9KCT2_9ACTN|nr:lyase family protein [Nonomuraea africana]MBE1559362.1 3-carboxy-cis,cis-muconate cycloisomerase [Nonomuraea africana]
MTSAETSADVGLLSAGSAAAAATGDEAFLQAMLDAEAALTRAWASLTPGLTPEAPTAARASGEAASDQAASGGATPASGGTVPDDAFPVPGWAARAVTEAARADRFDLPSLVLRAREGGNPVIPLVADLTAAVGDRAGRYVHLGATSQDIMDTALMLVAHRALGGILSDLSRTAGALAVLAAEHRDTPMPGRTLTQHAVPTTFGLKAAGWRALTLDAHDRLLAVRRRLPAQLGGAAGTLAAFSTISDTVSDTVAGTSDVGPRGWDAVAGTSEAGSGGSGGASVEIGLLLVAAFARETGLAEPALPWHVLRTPVADLGGALAFAAGALGKLAADVLVLSRTEIGEVNEGAGGGSSAMPHKSNPVRATWIAAAARRTPALAAVLYGALAAEDERPAGAWHAEWQTLRDALRLVGGAARDAAELAEGLRVHTERMRANLDLTGGLIVSERVAAALAPVLGRERARALLAAATPGSGLRQALQQAAGDRLDLHDLLDPTHYLGAAPTLVDRALRRTTEESP